MPTQGLGEGGRATRAEVDLDAFSGNIRAILASVQPGVELMAIVKANAYGHGAPMIAAAAVEAGAARLAVATVSEGRQLRAAGISAPVLVLGPVDSGEVPTALDADLELTVATPDLLDAVERAAAARPAKRFAMHVKVDTGLRRYGAFPDLAASIARRLAAHPSIALEGISTHFATSEDEDDTFALEQLDVLRGVVDRLADEGIRPRRVHVANSGATFREPIFQQGCVRPGIAIYGLAPSEHRPLLPGMRPVLTLRSRLLRVFELAPGDTVGYGRTYRAERPVMAGLVPVGYADGYRRQLSGRSWMSVQGVRSAVLGRVSMDQSVIALPAGLTHEVGDEVVVAGADPDRSAPTMDQLGDLLGTNSYEMLTGISPRVPRHYLRGGNVVAVADALLD